MRWNAKLCFANAGAGVAVALLLGLMGNPLCFASLLAAAVQWNMGNGLLDAYKDKKEGE